MLDANLQKIINDRKLLFYNFCTKNNNLYNNLPKLSLNLNNEAILIEFRLLPHLPFIIKNCIYNLGNNWSFTIICGLLNYDFILKIKNDNNLNIKIINKNINNLTREEYSIMLLHSEFWKLFLGNNLLIYQEDSIIFKNFNNNYFKYDYIGAPFFNKNIGNGGLSFRKKNTMIYICEKYFDKKKETFNKIVKHIKICKNNNKKYNYNYEEIILEDLQITNIMRNYKLGLLPSFNIAKDFSIEKYYNNDSFGGHQIWYCVNNMNKFLNKKILNI